MIRFSCPTCGKRLAVSDERAGRSGKCTCGELVRVPHSCSPSEEVVAGDFRKTEDAPDKPKSLDNASSVSKSHPMPPTLLPLVQRSFLDSLWKKMSFGRWIVVIALGV